MHGRGGRYLTEEEKASRPRVTKELLVRIGGHLGPYWKQLVLALICVTASSVLNLYPAILTGRIIDEGLIGQDLPVLVKLIVLSLGVTLAANLIGVLESWLNAWISQHVTFDMRNRMFRHLEMMPQQFFTSGSQGDIITRMTSDIDGVETVISNTFTSILSNAITLIAAIAAMMHKNVLMAVLGMLVVPLFVIPTRRAGKTRWTLTREAQACNDRINGILGETMSVSGQLLVKLFGREDYEYDRFVRENREMIGYHIRERMAGRWFRVAISTFAGVGPMLLYLAGGILMIRGGSGLTVGDITVLVTLLSKMYGPISQLLNIQVDWIRAMALFTRIFSYLDMPVEIESPADAVVPEKATGAVTFSHVDFAYEKKKAGREEKAGSLEAGNGSVLSSGQKETNLKEKTGGQEETDLKKEADLKEKAGGQKKESPAGVSPAEDSSEKPVSLTDQGDSLILHDVSFSLEPGKSIAIVGPSGAGKSTIVSLIPRLYDVLRGSVCVDGVDVRRLDLSWLRANIGIVTQDTYLFNGSLRENLLYAKPDATEDELIDACRKANIYDMIRALPDGFDTLVGNRGLRLSGGERQRVSIARVLLKDPALLIFDEATSALDSISESLIQAAIDPLIRSRTSILIAHRLSTILAADKILVVRDGRIVEEGTHTGLLLTGGVYSELYRTQFCKEPVA